MKNKRFFFGAVVVFVVVFSFFFFFFGFRVVRAQFGIAGLHLVADSVAVKVESMHTVGNVNLRVVEWGNVASPSASSVEDVHSHAVKVHDVVDVHVADGTVVETEHVEHN